MGGVEVVTVSSDAGLVRPFKLAVIFDVPGDTPVAKPAVLMVAVEVVAEFQAAVEVTVWVVESL